MHEAMQAAAYLGARVFVCDAVGLCAQQAQGRQERHARYAEALARLLDAGAGLGCRIAIENHTQDEALFVTPDDFLGLAAAPGLDALGACWDTGHGWIEGQPPEAACRLGSRLVTLHIHDNDGRHDQHRLPGKGGIDWQPFIAGLRRMRYRGPFMMEIVPSAPTVDGIDRLVRDAVDVYSRQLLAGPATLSSMG
jgi:sugar phosphate isomerase/epimerase